MKISRRSVIVAVSGALLGVVALPAVAAGPPGTGNSRPSIEFAKGAQSVAANAGTATVTVTRSGKVSQLTGTSTVDYATSGATATGGASCGTAGVDYITQAGTITFPPTAVTRVITLTICPDSVYEGNQTLILSLSNITGANYGSKKTMVLTITETVAKPVVSIANAPSVVEGGTASFPVRLNGNTDLDMPLTVTAVNGTAIAGVNFTNFGSAFNSTVPAGNYSNFLLGNVTVSTLNDGTYTGPLHFTVVLAATNATVSGSPATGTITDAGPVLTVADSSAWMGDPVGFPVALSYQVPYPITFHWTTQANGSGSGAADCTTNPNFVTSSGDVTVPANTPAGQVAGLYVPTCPPANSQASDVNKTFSVHLSTLSAASVGPDANGLIRNTVPYKTTVQVNPSAASDGVFVNETVTVANQSGDGLPNLAVRGEVYRDNDNDPGEFDGEFFTSTADTVLTDGNGQIFSSYTAPAGFVGPDYLYACVPGFELATTTDCHVTSDIGEGVEFGLSTPPSTSTTGLAVVTWTP